MEYRNVWCDAEDETAAATVATAALRRAGATHVDIRLARRGTHDQVLVAGAVEGAASRRLRVDDAELTVASNVDETVLESVAAALAATLGRIEARRQADSARRRLADSERVGRMGSFDWEIARDSNDWSDELFRIYGYEPGGIDPSYETFISLLHPDDRDRVRRIHEAALRDRAPFVMEERIRRPDGEERILWSQGEVVCDANGQPIRMIGICRDVTEQRAAEAAAEVAAAEFAEIELRRRQALELNDTVVQGLVSLLWRLGDDADARSAAEATLAAAKRIMTDLLAPTRGEASAGPLVRSAPAGQPLAGRAVPPPPTPDLPAPACRIVIADDAADIRMLLRVFLGRADGLEVVGEAADGAEAVELVRRHAPDVVLLDVSMPVLDGLEAAERIRALGLPLDVIVFSGYPAETMRARAIAAGADEYVEKTADLQPLVDLLVRRAAAPTG